MREKYPLYGQDNITIYAADMIQQKKEHTKPTHNENGRKIPHLCTGFLKWILIRIQITIFIYNFIVNVNIDVRIRIALCVTSDDKDVLE